MTTPDRDKLIERLLTAELSPEQQHQLHELIAGDAQIEAEVIDQMWLEPLLRDHYADDPDAFVARIDAALNDDEQDSVEFTERVLSKWTERSTLRTKSRLLRWSAGIVVAVAVVVGLILYWPGATAEAAQWVRIQNATGRVEVIAADGRARPADFGTVIQPGDTVRTSGASSATISCADESRIILTRGASITWPNAGAEPIVLHSGLAHVVRSPSELTAGTLPAIVVATPHVTIEVPEIDFLLAASDHRTDITVRRGTAVVTATDGRTVRVSQGQCGTASRREFLVKSGTATPDAWSEDFESGLPEEWQGHFVDTELPAGSRGAVGTAASVNEDGEECHQIWTYADWQHGLAVVHDDTCLNFVYRFKTADRVQVMTLLRSPVPDTPDHDVQILQPSDVPDAERWWNIPSREWHVVSIPLARLSNPVSREHPRESYVATAFNFRPQNHACGLVIDRMWLERGTSDRIEFRPLNRKRSDPSANEN